MNIHYFNKVILLKNKIYIYNYKNNFNLVAPERSIHFVNIFLFNQLTLK